MLCVNTAFAMNGLADGVHYNVMKYDYAAKKHREVTVRPGPGAVRILNALRESLPGGLGGASDVRTAGQPTAGREAGSHQGSAMWPARLWTRADSDVRSSNMGWKEMASSSRFRPDGEELLRAYGEQFACGRQGGEETCAELRCPDCWIGETVQDNTIACSRFDHHASAGASSGKGSLKGGDVRHISPTTDSCFLGDGGGEDVEIWRNRPSQQQQSNHASDVTMAKVLYFFTHRANKRLNADVLGPPTRWLLAFEYVTAGVGNARYTDVATEHPVLVLRARGRPRVFAAANVKRHIHMYHLCPCLRPVNSRGSQVSSQEGERRVCGVALGLDGAKVWQHDFKLAVRGGRGSDKYLLNEHHHSLSQDPFLGD